MPLTKVVVTVQVWDSSDILREYLDWYVSLDVDLILANDFGSTDGSQDILEEFARRNLVQWSPHPDKHAKDYDDTIPPSKRPNGLAHRNSRMTWSA